MAENRHSYKIIPVLLAGGVGKRLEPLSRPEMPKQFLRLIRGRSLFQQTLLRAAKLNDLPWVVTGDGFRDLVVDQAEEVGVKLGHLIVEPMPRGTAPALAVAAGLAYGTDVLVSLPCDHLFDNEDDLLWRIRTCADAVVDNPRIVALGVRAKWPHDGFGYLVRDGDGDVAALREFVEKPPTERAQALIDDGALWNTGIFVARANSYLVDYGHAVSRETC